MILSMTGFGHSVIDTEVGQLSASVRSVNSRYLDIKIRGLNIDPKVERDIRQLISKNFDIRGLIKIKILKASERKILTIQIRKVDN